MNHFKKKWFMIHNPLYRIQEKSEVEIYEYFVNLVI
jgi:hypothetical protein